MRAVLTRPNSSFLDLDIRYSLDTPQNRLKKIKRLMKVQLQMSDIWCCLWGFLVLVLLSVGLFLIFKYEVKIITFPKL